MNLYFRPMENIPVTFTFAGKQKKGTLTKVHGMNGWFLHGSDLIDLLIWEGKPRWKGGCEELTAQLDYFEDVLIAWYE